MVVEQGMRRCLVCEEWFTRDRARQHSDVVCYPQPQSPVPPTLIEEVATA